MTLTTDLTKLMIQDAHSLTSRYPHLLQFSLADDGVQQAVEKRFASGQIPNGIHLLPAHQAAAPTIATTRRLRRASVLAGVSLVLFGLASASPALATQEPIIDDLSIPNPPLVSCFGQPVDMWVPPGGGTFYGDNNDNVIMGTGGDDRIFGGGGIDSICQPDGDATGYFQFSLPRPSVQKSVF